MYADYEFYKANWSGKVPEQRYNYTALRAAHHMDYLTFNRINANNLTDQIKLCQCELCDYLYALDQQAASMEIIDGKGVVKSETVDIWKREYTAPLLSLEYAKTNTDTMIANICKKWLTRPNNLMYAGVDL